MAEIEFVFDDLAPKEKPVTLGKDRYVLREASAEAGRQFKTAAGRCHKMSNGKLTGLDGIGELEPLLVSLCLFHEGGKPVTRMFVNSLHNRIVKPMFDWVREVSELSERQEKDPDPELIGLCRRDLATQHHPDAGGDAGVMRGVNLALDWLKAHRREEQGDPSKNGQSSLETTSEPPASLAAQ